MMIYNEICAYCNKPMVLKGTDVGVPLKATVEHLIPHIALSRKRGNGEGDFRACKTCNNDKSTLDYVIGIIAKANNADDQVVIDALYKALGDGKKYKRYASMIASANCKDGVVELSLPINSDELYKYVTYLAKGQYYKENNEYLCLKDKVIFCDLLPNQFVNYLNSSYLTENGSLPFDDLVKNPNSEVILDGECIIWSKNDSYMFVFQKGLILIVEVLEKNNQNIALVTEKLLSLNNT
ncbi:hypothetical protein HYO25_21860 [Vibrio parahaemolyticus]|nr:hypothetical protein [Vibrio parahaemolyticus]